MIRMSGWVQCHHVDTSSLPKYVKKLYKQSINYSKFVLFTFFLSLFSLHLYNNMGRQHKMPLVIGNTDCAKRKILNLNASFEYGRKCQTFIAKSLSHRVVRLARMREYMSSRLSKETESEKTHQLSYVTND